MREHTERQRTARRDKKLAELNSSFNFKRLDSKPATKAKVAQLTLGAPAELKAIKYLSEARASEGKDRVAMPVNAVENFIIDPRLVTREMVEKVQANRLSNENKRRYYLPRGRCSLADPERLEKFQEQTMGTQT